MAIGDDVFLRVVFELQRGGRVRLEGSSAATVSFTGWSVGVVVSVSPTFGSTGAVMSTSSVIAAQRTSQNVRLIRSKKFFFVGVTGSMVTRLMSVSHTRFPSVTARCEPC